LLEAGAKIAKKTMIEKHVQRYQAPDSADLNEVNNE
jgi:hypothetical protein